MSDTCTYLSISICEQDGSLRTLPTQTILLTHYSYTNRPKHHYLMLQTLRENKCKTTLPPSPLPQEQKCPAQEQGLRRGAQPGCEGQQRCRRSTRGAEGGSIPEVAEGKSDVPLLTCLSDIGYPNVKLTAHLLIPLWVRPVDFLKGSQSTQQKTRNPNNSTSVYISVADCSLLQQGPPLAALTAPQSSDPPELLGSS